MKIENYTVLWMVLWSVTFGVLVYDHSIADQKQRVWKEAKAVYDSTYVDQCQQIDKLNHDYIGLTIDLNEAVKLLKDKSLCCPEVISLKKKLEEETFQGRLAENEIEYLDRALYDVQLEKDSLLKKIELYKTQ